MNLTPERIAMRKLLFTNCQTKEDLHDWIYIFLDLDLPDCRVDEDSNTSPLDMVWSTYDHVVLGHGDEKVSKVLYYSARTAGKTLSESVTEVLLLLHFRMNIYHLAAIEQQSTDAQNYLKKFFSFPYLNEFVDGDSKRSTAVSYYVPKKELADNGGFPLSAKEWQELSQDEQDLYTLVSNECVVIVATLASVNGKHGLLCLDEADLINSRRVYEEAMNIPVHYTREDGSMQLPVTIITSTRKTAYGLVNEEVQNADKTGLIVKHWNILDVTQACPTKRHLPEEPRIPIYRSDSTLTAITEDNYESLSIKEKEDYVKDEGYAGCLKNCKMFAACRGRLATRQTSTSRFLKPIQYVENQFKNQSVDMAQAQLLCWLPSQTGLIFPRFKKERHMISPSRAYWLMTGKNHPNPALTKGQLMEILKQENIGGEWFGGMDFGFSHVFSYSSGYQLGNTMFIPHILAIPNLEPDQQLQVMEPFRCLDPKIWPDTENPQMISVFKNKGWRMAKWPKNGGSLAGGLSIVQMKLCPPMNALVPELYFIHDVGEDPMMDLAAKHMAEFHYKLGADGNPTDIVADVNKDIPDAVRYLVMNRFTPKGTAVTSNEEIPQQKYYSVYDQPQYGEEWMGEKITELIGEDYVPQKNRPRMAIEAVDVKSYYAEQNKKKPLTKGSKAGIIWDLS